MRGPSIRHTWLALALAVAAIAGMPARAWALECGTSLVTEGDPVDHLLAACGQPVSRTVVARRYSRYPGAEVWTYDFGPTRDRVAVMVRGGRVLSIQSLGPGTSAAPRERSHGRGRRGR
jgi:hypothetical protein